MDNIQQLLHGKSNLKRVVGLEVGEAEAEVFVQGEDGSISSVFVPNRFFILAHTNINGKFVRLKGDLHYKWGMQFQDKSTWKKLRSVWKNDDIYSVWNPEKAMQLKDGITFYQDLKMKDISLLSWDLETSGLDGNAKDARIFLISTTYRDQHGQVNRLFSFDDYENEGEMIEDFCIYVREKNPSLLVGHNIIPFDFPYIQARADYWGVPLAMGRDYSSIQISDFESKFRLDGTRDLMYKNVSVYGREVVDTFFLANSFDVSKSLESYALKPLIKQLGFEKEGRQHYDASLIRKNFAIPEEWKKIKQYAIDDAEDSVKVFDHMGTLYFNMAQMIPMPFSEILLSASGSKIDGLMIRAYLQDGHSLPKSDEMQKYEGAISFCVPGIYSNCFKIDLASLYPSVMIEYEVYPEEKDPKGYLLQFVKAFRGKRLEYKKLAAETGDSYWHEMDTTAKGILNSFYGFCGTNGLLFNSLSCAEFITAKGREILEYTIKWASGKELKEFITEDEVADEAV